MKSIEGNLKKMKVIHDDPVKYILELEEDVIINDHIGNTVHLNYAGYINCIVCGKKLNKAYGQGFCYPDFINSPRNSPCIIKPELCEAHLGKGRDPEWEEKNHNKEHIVYLALSSNVKVGVTRVDQIPIRWIDQGASEALIFARVPYRNLAGQIEVALKQHIADKTNWRKMLANIVPDDKDLFTERQRLITYLNDDLKQYIDDSEKLYEIEYPVLEYPEKVKSINLLKIAEFSGELKGVKGQYLLFENGYVFNVRNHSGYRVELKFG